MTEIFKNDEEGYLQWVAINKQTGFILNSDYACSVRNYPMIHRADCKMLSNRENYTNNSYFKVCSGKIPELEIWAKNERGRSLTYCKKCKWLNI